MIVKAMRSPPYLAPYSDPPSIELLDVKSRRSLKTLQGHTHSINGGNFSDNGAWFVSASDDTTARVWNVSTGECVSVLKGHNAYVTSASFHPKLDIVVTSSFDATIKIWDFRAGRLLDTLHGHKNCVGSAYFDAEGAQIVSAGEDGTARIWDGTMYGALLGDPAVVLSAAISCGCGVVPMPEREDALMKSVVETDTDLLVALGSAISRQVDGG